jgi:AraC-like DNA-binding protein
MKRWLHGALPAIIAGLEAGRIVLPGRPLRGQGGKGPAGGPVPVQFYLAPSPHSHKHPEIAVVLEGPVFFEIDKRATAVQQGSVLIFPSQTLHYDSYISPKTPYSLLWYILWPASPRVNLSRYRPGKGFELAAVLELKVELIPEDDWAYVASLKHARSVRVERMRELLYSLLAATLEAGRRHGPASATSATRTVARDAIAFLKEHLGEAPTVDMAASFVGLSPTYLTTLVRKEVGKPLHDILAGMRLDKAAELLKNTRLSVKEIARLSGFSSADYFTRAFHRTTGVSPRQYRMPSAR